MSVHLKWLVRELEEPLSPYPHPSQRELMGSWPKSVDSRKEMEHSQISIGQGNK